MKLENCKKAIDLANRASSIKFSIKSLEKEKTVAVYRPDAWKYNYAPPAFITTVNSAFVIEILENELIDINDQICALGVTQ